MPENLDFSKDVLHIADLGIKEISVEPVVSGPEGPIQYGSRTLILYFANTTSCSTNALIGPGHRMNSVLSFQG